jgi:hypothetical protein
MKKTLLKFTSFGLLAFGLTIAPLQLTAQTTNKAAAEKKAEKKPSAHPFHGNLTAIDKTAKTITVGKVTYQITSETKIKKADKPATLDDGVVGEEVRGYVKPSEDGKMAASSVSFGPKTEGKGAAKKKEAKK